VNEKVREGPGKCAIGCPPGIRTPICCSRGSCPTIERGGNAVNKKPADSAGFPILRAGVPLVNPSAPLCSSRGEEADSRKRLSSVSPVLNRPGAAAEESHPDRGPIVPGRTTAWLRRSKGGCSRRLPAFASGISSASTVCLSSSWPHSCLRKAFRSSGLRAKAASNGCSTNWG
jgi:hypothetical protein